jgi:hypothetical protein
MERTHSNPVDRCWHVPRSSQAVRIKLDRSIPERECRSSSISSKYRFPKGRWDSTGFCFHESNQESIQPIKAPRSPLKHPHRCKSEILG